jgi:hypothetical protein
MIILRILVNAVIMAGELAAAVGIAAFGYYHPFLFAAVTAALSFALGLRLEVARLRYELPFYFGGVVRPSLLLTGVVGFIEALFKAVVAGLAALFTFSGTDADRLVWVAAVFGVCVYVGATGLRLLNVKGEPLPLRWGYFRLAPVLGLVFSAAMALLAAAGVLPVPSVGDIGWKIIFDVPSKPSIEQVSELLFQLKQAFDEFIVSALSVVIDKVWAQIAGVIISVNVLSGFVSALYAALISTAVQKAEDELL